MTTTACHTICGAVHPADLDRVSPRCSSVLRALPGSARLGGGDADNIDKRAVVIRGRCATGTTRIVQIVAAGEVATGSRVTSVGGVPASLLSLPRGTDRAHLPATSPRQR